MIIKEATCYFCNYRYRTKHSPFYKTPPFTSMCIKKHEVKGWLDKACCHYTRNSDVIDTWLEDGKRMIKLKDEVYG